MVQFEAKLFHLMERSGFTKWSEVQQVSDTDFEPEMEAELLNNENQPPRE